MKKHLIESMGVSRFSNSIKGCFEILEKVRLLNNCKETELEDISQYLINCLVSGDTDVKRNELTELELKLLNELQKLNISLINNQMEYKDRKVILTQHSVNFKLINY
jgi:hypothetical protein